MSSLKQEGRSLAQLHLLSLVTKAILLVLALLQGFLVVRLLSPADYGLVGIALAITGSVGILQNLGLSAGTVREIVLQTGSDRKSMIYSVALVARLSVNVPLVIVLWLLADILAYRVYQRPAIALPIRLISIQILLTSICQASESALLGLKQFTNLFIAHIAISGAAVLFLVVSVLLWGFEGYFIGTVVGTALATSILSLLAFKAFDFRIVLPQSMIELRTTFLTLMGVALTIFVVRLLYTFYLNLPVLILGLRVPPDDVGYFSFGQKLSLHLLSVSNAINMVNTPSMSEQYTYGMDSLRHAVEIGSSKVLAIVGYLAVALIVFAREVTLLIGGNTYLPALQIMSLMISAFFCYAVLDIASASVLIPLDARRRYIQAYTILLGVSGICIVSLVLGGYGILGAALGMVCGAFAALIFITVTMHREFGIVFIGKGLLLAFATLIPALIAQLIWTTLWSRGLLFLLSSLLFAYTLDQQDVMELRSVGRDLLLKVQYLSTRWRNSSHEQ